MLSILIPTYNYDAFPLVENLFNQCEKAGIEYEIIVFDDGSENQFNNYKINKFPTCRFELLSKNIGLSAIRNLLVKNAKYDWLLILDADTFPVKDNYIHTFLNNIRNTAYQYFSGGIIYKDENPPQNKILRWKYGKEREAISLEERKRGKHNFTNINIVINKSIFSKISFDEKIRYYGYEDVVFTTDALQYTSALPLDNPVYHLDQSTSEEFLQKSKTALQTLHFLIENKRIEPDKIKIAKVYVTLKKYRLTFLIRIFYKIFERPIRNQLLGTNPNLKLFDLYRLGYLCSINKK